MLFYKQNFKSFLGSKGIIIVLICIIIFHIFNNYFWIKNDEFSWYPEKYYQLLYKNYILSSLKEIFQNNRSFLSKVIYSFRLLNTDMAWPKLFHIYVAIINLVFGNETNISLMANIPFFMLLGVFTFLIGREIASAKAGVLAAFLISFYPGIFGVSRSYGLDFPLTAMVVITIYLLIRAGDFRKIKYALSFSLFAGLAVLVKGLAIFFIAGPLVYVVYRFIYLRIIHNKKNGDHNKLNVLRTSLGLGLSLGLIILLSSFWWFGNLKNLFAFLFYITTTPKFYSRILIPQKHLFEWVFFYLVKMNYIMSPLLFFSFCFSFLIFCRTKIKYKPIILLWALVPYFLFTVIVAKSERYYFPAIPAVALITAIGLLRIESKKIRQFLIMLITIVSLIQFYDLSFSTAILPKELFYPKPTTFLAQPPQKCKEGKVAEKFLETIKKTKKDKSSFLLVPFVGTPDLIDSGRLEYIFETKGNEVKIKKFWDRDFSKSTNYDYIIIVNKKIGGRQRNDKPDLTFLKTFDYQGFFMHNYPQVNISKKELEEMYGFFTKFITIDYYISNNEIFFFCKKETL